VIEACESESFLNKTFSKQTCHLSLSGKPINMRWLYHCFVCCSCGQQWRSRQIVQRHRYEKHAYTPACLGRSGRGSRWISSFNCYNLCVSLGSRSSCALSVCSVCNLSVTNDRRSQPHSTPLWILKEWEGGLNERTRWRVVSGDVIENQTAAIFRWRILFPPFLTRQSHKRSTLLKEVAA
jgi:hypothetical protein